ncbi:unnamed protein product, partial [Oncorhynchus mykiss]
RTHNASLVDWTLSQRTQCLPEDLFNTCVFLRYECPAGCLKSTGKVVGTVHYEMQSSICRAGLHSGVVDKDGGWLDVTRQGRKDFFIKSNKNGIQSLGKYQSANSFIISKVAVKAITCETTVAQMCSYQKLVKHCPRLYCPRNCMEENPNISRVIGTGIYSDVSGSAQRQIWCVLRIPDVS